jgi:ubiquinone/menaquinone biosynthesis C-methylase UbiE
MDIFGFKNQGINYDKFRPRYPSVFIDRYLKNTKHKNRYLDIATGTGQLLFAFAPHFKESKGIDISNAMVETASLKAKEFMEKNPQNKI